MSRISNGANSTQNEGIRKKWNINFVPNGFASFCVDLRRRPLNRLFGGETQWPESVTYHGAGIALRPVPHIKRPSRSSRRANLQEQWRDGHSDFILLAISKSQAQPRYLSIRVRKRFHARQFSGVAVGRQPGDQSYR